MANIVIMVWKQHADAGFGDLLRGTIYLHKLSQKMKFNLIVDIQFHPVSQFLVPQPHEHSAYVIQNQSQIINAINVNDNFIINQLRDHNLSNNPNPNPVLITTNYSDNHHESPSVECKHFMRSLLIPTNEFKAWFNDTCNAFKIPKYYSILHFRLGDDELIHHNENPEQYNNLFNMVNSNMKTIPNLYMMTDSAKFKQYLRRALHPTLTYRIISTTPVHLSHPDADIETVKDTLFDFMLLTNARFIKTHSVYGWISGFVQWVSHIFNVPLINLRPRNQPIKMHLFGSDSQQQPMHQLAKPMQPMQPMKPMQLKSILSFMKPIRSNSDRKSKMAFSKMF